MVRAGIAAADAGRLTARALSPRALEATAIVAAGKAAVPMARAAMAERRAPPASALVITSSPAEPMPPFEIVVGGHPLPDAASERAGRRALQIASAVAPDATLLVLLSGGASALMSVPADGISLEDKRRTTERLLAAGADIHALNIVRKHLSAIKGGWLAARTRGSVETCAISDVVGDDLSAIASGPTVGDTTTFADAIGVLRRYNIIRSAPSAVIDRLDAGVRGEVPETPKPDDPRLARSAARVIGGRGDAIDGAAAEGERRGYHVLRFDDAITGEARVTAVSHLRAAIARAAEVGRPACIVSGGETTVAVKGGGRGGRNQEFALALVEPLSALDLPAAAASAGTDGIDGPTDAAGALVDSRTLDRARAADLGAPSMYLDDNNAYAFFDALGDLINTGPTGTNVGDLQVILLA